MVLCNFTFCSKDWVGYLVLAIGAILFLSGLIVIILVETGGMLNKIVQDNLALREGSEVYEQFARPTFPALRSLYLFEIKNKDGFLGNEERPQLEEKGPFVFEAWVNRTDIEFHDNHTVSFRQSSSLFFRPDLSRGTLQDQITTLNPVAAGLNKEMVRNIFARATGGEVVVTKSVDELLFSGYQDSILDCGRQLGRDVPDKFAYFYQQQRDRDDGAFNMDTGTGDISKIGTVYSWNYRDTFAEHLSKPCFEVRGQGQLFPPNPSTSFFEVFTPDLCRNLRLDYAETSSYKDTRVYLYKISKKLFAADDPDNDACLFRDGPERNPDAKMASGVFEAGMCFEGQPRPPLFMSQPHFYQGDESYQLDGLRPDAKKHETVFTVEPLSGVPFQVLVRAQINFFLDNYGPVRTDIFKDMVDRVMVPTLWTETNVTLPPDVLSDIALLTKARTIFLSVGSVLLVAGLVLLALFAVHFVNMSVKRGKPETGIQAGKVLVHSGSAKKKVGLEKRSEPKRGGRGRRGKAKA